MSFTATGKYTDISIETMPLKNVLRKQIIKTSVSLAVVYVLCSGIADVTAVPVCIVLMSMVLF